MASGYAHTGSPNPQFGFMAQIQFFCLAFSHCFQMWPISASSVNRSDSACSCMVVNMEAPEVSVYHFIKRLMCRGNQRIHEQMIRSARRRRAKFFIALLMEQWLLLPHGAVCVRWEWWDRDVNGFTETDFIQHFGLSGATFNICQHLSTARHSVQASEWRKGGMNSDTTVQTETPASHMKLAQIRIDKIWIPGMCAVHTVM